MADGYKTSALNALGGGPKKAGGGKKGKLKEMRIRAGHEGGFIAKHEHEHEPMEMHEDREYPLADQDALIEHIKAHFPGKGMKGKETAENAKQDPGNSQSEVGD